MNRRKALGITAGAVLSNGAIIKSVSAQSGEISKVTTPVVEVTLTYDGDLENTTNVETECGPQNHIVHNSGLYVGKVDAKPYLSQSPVVLMNSKVSTKKEPFPNTPSNSFPIKDMAGNKKRVKLQNEFKLPNLIVERASGDLSEMSIEDKKIKVKSGESESIKLDSQTVEVRKTTGKTKKVDVDQSNMELKEGITPPDSVSVKETELKQIDVTPSVQITHHGKVDIYGVEDGLVLPNDDRLSAVRRAKEQGAIKSDVHEEEKALLL